MTRLPITTITTDFGLQDGYVAAMKGVMLGLVPDLSLVDISHVVPPQNVRTAAWIVRTTLPYFPSDTVHLVIVDPGVGTERQPIAVETPQGRFVGPDNGVLSWLLMDSGDLDPATGELRRGKAVTLSNPEFHRSPVSHTFHGRDIFAPVAARIAGGLDLDALGEPVSHLIVLPLPTARKRRGRIYGTVLYIDHFGNAISNIEERALPPDPIILVANVSVRGLASSYQDGEVVALVGSSGYVEIGVRNGSAADRLGIGEGTEIVIWNAG